MSYMRRHIIRRDCQPAQGNAFQPIAHLAGLIICFCVSMNMAIINQKGDQANETPVRKIATPKQDTKARDRRMARLKSL